jgi:hypothetical protein
VILTCGVDVVVVGVAVEVEVAVEVGVGVVVGEGGVDDDGLDDAEPCWAATVEPQADSRATKQASRATCRIMARIGSGWGRRGMNTRLPLPHQNRCICRPHTG